MNGYGSQHHIFHAILFSLFSSAIFPMPFRWLSAHSYPVDTFPFTHIGDVSVCVCRGISVQLLQIISVSVELISNKNISSRERIFLFSRIFVQRANGAHTAPIRIEFLFLSFFRCRCCFVCDDGAHTHTTFAFDIQLESTVRFNKLCPSSSHICLLIRHSDLSLWQMDTYEFCFFLFPIRFMRTYIVHLFLYRLSCPLAFF